MWIADLKFIDKGEEIHKYVTAASKVQLYTKLYKFIVGDWVECRICQDKKG